MARVKVIEWVMGTSAQRAFTIRAKGVSQVLQQRMIPRMRLAFSRFLNRVVDVTIATTVIKRRSGRMFRQLKTGQRITGTGRINTLKAQIFADPYVGLHEFGGLVRPVNSRMLTLPLPAALRADGTPKKRNAPAWRSFGTFIFPNRKQRRRGSKLFIAYKNKASGRLVFLYSLHRRVRMPTERSKRNLGLRRTFNLLRPELLAAWGVIMISEFRQVNLCSLARIRTGTRLLRAVKPKFAGR